MRALLGTIFAGKMSFSAFFDPFRHFSVVDIFDILALAFLFYLVYLFVRDRRAGKLFCGVVVALVLYALVRLLRLYAVYYVFSLFLGYGVLLVIIVFQPELRAMVEKLGALPFKSLKGVGVEPKNMLLSPDAVQKIVDAAKQLSFEKTGALIVIERGTKIGEYIQSGTTLNAELSVPLLRALFVNGAPLHDGAVIIRGGRIFAAGCFLPLSAKEDIHKELGTRHRAAIGISEESDCIAVVVSEETGTISVACGGHLYRYSSTGQLRRKLFELLGKDVEKEESGGAV